jgi:predicted phosphodiesterase
MYALKLLKKYDMVILGHTHKLESHKIYYLNNKKIYLNCGTCSLGRFQAIVVDTETFEYETVKIPKKSELVVSQLPILKRKK